MLATELKRETHGDWMYPQVATIQYDETLEDAVAKMRTLMVHHLVVMQGEEYAGILDARDCAGVWDPDREVGQLMRADIPLVDEKVEIGAVVELMLTRGISAIALKGENKIHGVITTTDLVRLLEAQVSDRHNNVALLEKGESFLATPFVQSFSRLLGNAGL